MEFKLIFILLFAAITVNAQTIQGPNPVGQGSTYTYTYDAGRLLINPVWTASKGTIQNVDVFGQVYHVVINWTATGSGWIKINNEDGLLDTKTITINSCSSLGVPSIGNVARCGPGTVVLTASPGSGGTVVRWYNMNTDSPVLATGSSYTTSHLTSSNAYKVSTYNPTTGCESSRVTVQVTINPTPVAPIAYEASRCGSGSVLVTASPGAGGDVVRWYAALSGGSAIATGASYTTPSLSGTITYYSSTYNSSTGCESVSRTPAVATINLIPAAAGATSTALCGSGTIVAAAGANGNTTRWYNASTGGTPLVTSTTSPITHSTTTYYVSSYNTATSCESTAARTAAVLTINAVPSAATATSTAVCGSGTMVAATGANGNTTRWYSASTGGTPLATSTTSPVTSSTTTYYVSSYNSTTTCESTAARVAAILTINSVPAAATATSTALCGSGTIVAAAGANGNTTRWYNASTGGTPLVTSTTSPITHSTTTYYVSSYNTATSCESTAARTAAVLTINAVPSAATATSTAVCGSGTMVAATGANGNTTRWYSASTGGTPLATSTTSPVTSSTTTYYVSSYNSTTTCESTAARTATVLTINAVPSAATATSTAVCGSGTMVAAAGSGGNTTRWYSAATGGTPLATSTTSPMTSSTTTYYVSSYNSGTTCESTAARTATVLTINAIPAAATGTSASRCGNGTVTLTGNFGLSGNTIRWYAAPTGGSTLSTGSSYTTPSISSTTPYYISSYNSGTGCESTTSRILVTASVNTVPATPAVSGSNRFESGSLMLIAAGTSAGGSYTWYNPSNSVLASGSTYSTPPLSASTSNYVYVRATSSTGCHSSATWVSIAIYPLPLVTATRTYVVKGGNETLDAGVGYDTYTWKNSTLTTVSTTRTLVTNKPDTYTVVVTKGGVTAPAQAFVLSTQLGQINMNYIATNTFIAPTTDAALVETFPIDSVTQTIQYFDGLGRPIQSVNTQGSPDRKDIVQPFVYDAFGREAKKYLPYVSIESNGLYKNNSVMGPTDYTGSPHQLFYNNTADNVANDSNPFAVTVFEASPLNRVLKQGASGSVWQPIGSETNFSDKTIKKTYQFNRASDNVLRWKYVPENGLVDHHLTTLTGSETDYYEAGQLYSNKSYDEHNNEVIEFVNKDGQTILKKVQYAAEQYACTYYVYDDLGKLRVVLQPEGVKRLATEYFGKTISMKEGFLDRWAFRYKYDHRLRMTEKQVPGAGKVLMVYDDRDRLAMVQDSMQVIKREWTLTKYDTLNRPVITATYIHPTIVDQVTMAGLLSKTKFCERFDPVQVTNHGYTSTVFPTTSYKVLNVNYYDNYDFKKLMPDSANYTYDANGIGIAGTKLFKRLRGMVTGSKINVLNTTSYLWSLNYYDNKYRMVQNIAQNYVGGRDYSTDKFDFAGRVKQHRFTHIKGTSTYTTLRRFAYDHAGRTKEVYHKFQSGPEILLIRNEYNALGELTAKKIHSTDNGTSFAQSTDYRYSIRGWLEKINDLATPEAKDLFSMELRYNNPSGNGGTAQYNGNISEAIWMSPGFDKQSYGYYYDSLNRLKEAHYHNISKPLENDRFNEIIGGVNTKGYDLNGNIVKLKRYGKRDINVYGLMDDLAYYYDGRGNQLTRVNDAIVTIDKEEGFKESIEATNEYNYDGNGNMMADQNKGITSIAYNYLNLIRNVYKSGTDSVVYTYDATGRKLKQQVYGSAPRITDYAGEFVYENDVLQFINHEEGRIIPLSPGEGAGGEVEYQYHLKDHLGNVRLTFTTKQEVEEAIASLETENENKERADFLKYDDIRKVNSPLFDHTDTGTTQYAQRLSGTPKETYGLTRSISVMPGDKVKAEVFAKYLDTNPANWTAALTDLVAVIASGATVPGSIDNGIGYTSASSTIPFASPVGKSTEPSDVPKAYLNWLVFDKNFVPLASKSGFRRISSAAMENGTLAPEGVPHEKLESPLIEINEPGYVYIYLSNEEPGKEVYFDDFSVTHTKSPVIQSDDYYPFGLTFNSYSRENSTANNYLYNGKEFQDELNLGWYDYLARQYDPTIGRFLAVDPAADVVRRWSTYSYAADNPIRFIDPDGMLFTDFIDENGNKTHVEDGSNAVFEIKKTDGLDQRKHYEFKEFDESQGGKNEVNVETVIQEQQNYNDNNEALEQASDGRTFCNYATQNIMDAVGSATGQNITITGRGNDMAEKLCDDPRYEAVDQGTAEKTAADGGLAVIAFRNYEKKADGTFRSGHLATFSVGDNIAKGKAANIGTTAYSGFQPEASSFFKKKDFETVRFYILKTQPNEVCK